MSGSREVWMRDWGSEREVQLKNITNSGIESDVRLMEGEGYWKIDRYRVWNPGGQWCHF